MLCILGILALGAGCGGGSGASFTQHQTPATPTPIPESLYDIGSLCQDAPTLTLPGTYAAFEALGALNGTTFTIDPSSQYQVFGYFSVEAPTPSPSASPSPTPNPSASAYDVWTGTVTYSGTPHDATICFVAAASVNRSVTVGGTGDNSQLVSFPYFGGPEQYIPDQPDAPTDTIDTMALTLSTTSTSSGSFTLAGGGHATITVTAHTVLTQAELRRALAAAIAAHKLPGPLR